MDRSIPLLLIGLVFGGGIGFLIAASNGVTLDGHNHSTTHAPQNAPHDHSQHDHSATQDVTGTAPTLEVTIVADSAAGWNLHLEVTDFRFAPNHVGQTPVVGEGHAHLYANGTKIARIYGDWYHIGSLPTGTTNIEVGLYSNDHKALTINGVPISQTAIIIN